MTKKAFFGKVALTVAKAVAPGVATVADLVVDHVQKQRTVEDIATAALEVGDLMTANSALASDPNFKKGMALVIEGMNEIRKATDRHHADAPRELDTGGVEMLGP